MPEASLSIADEVEAAIAGGSTEKCSQTAGHVTALFLASAGSLNEQQIALFGDVLVRLINIIELRAIADMGARIALAELSSQLAPVSQAPASVIRRLANHEEIRIAGPVLTESARLSADDLVEISRHKGEQHLLAISGRWWLTEIVTDALLARRYPSVSRRLVKNPGARISAAGFAIVVAQAASDPDLAIETGIRVDLPRDLRAQLLRHATEAVRARLLSRAPPDLFEEIRDAVSRASVTVNREMSKARDFDAAKMLAARLKKDGKLNEAVLSDFATQRKYQETVAVLAELSKSSVEIVRPLMQSLRSDGILVPCKVAGLNWETVSAVLDCRFSTGRTAPDELERLKSQFVRLTVEEANRLLGLWRVRSVPPSTLH